MTSKEAIELLSRAKPILATEELKTAIDMAIESLSQPIVAQHFDIQSGYIYCSPQDAENVKVVVLCKDCTHYSVEGKTTQFGWCNALEMPTDEHRFCSDGERKEPCRSD